LVVGVVVLVAPDAVPAVLLGAAPPPQAAAPKATTTRIGRKR
jgi:hypothetical protein